MNPVSFKRVILYARQHRANQEVKETLLRLIDFLSTQAVTTFFDVDTLASFGPLVPVLAREAMNGEQDLIVVVGGDGSLLSAARIAADVQVPVIGINRGKLGFLTDISPHEMELQLTQVLRGQFSEERRFLLTIDRNSNANLEFCDFALNDVVLSRGNETHLIDFDVYINEQYVSHYRSDGLILATPTGSTAYALSAGGPIMHPQLNAMVMVPMFSHSLSTRPLVFDADSSFSLKISASNEHSLSISCDGLQSHAINPGEMITVKKSTKQLKLLHPNDYHYYDTLRIKLGWGSTKQ